MRLTVSDHIGTEDWQYLTGWRDRVFPEEGRGFKWSPSRWHVLAHDVPQRPIAHLGFNAFSIGLDDRADVNVVGVGGVVVRPEYQGRGIPRLLFDTLHESDHARQLAGIFSLFCPHRLTGYYERFGYREYEGRFTFLQDGVETSTDAFVFMYRGPELAHGRLRVHSHPW